MIHRSLWLTKYDCKVSHLHHHAWMLECGVFAYKQDTVWCPIISTWISLVRKTIFPYKFYGLKCNFVNLNCAAVFLSETGGFFLEILPNEPRSYSFFVIALPWMLTFNMLNEFCRSRDVACKYFPICLSISTSDLGMNLLGHLLLHLWIIYLTLEW